MNQDLYGTMAQYYDDAYASQAPLADQAYYVNLATRLNRSVLDIACGTGRILMPIARSGLCCDGLDQSEAMLDILREKLKREPREVRERVSVHRADMRSFDLGKKYGLILMPFRALQFMHTLEDQLAALAAAKRHMARGALLALDVFYPNIAAFDAQLGREINDFSWTPEDRPDTTIRRYVFAEAHDKLHQLLSGKLIHRIYKDNQLVKEEHDAVEMTYYTYPQLCLLFRSAGLDIVEQYGRFDQAPLDNQATELIFVLRKSAARRKAVQSSLTTRKPMTAARAPAG